MAGQLTIDTLKASSGVLATQNGMTGIAKAWVNFDGTGTVAIRASFNVSSITDNGTGDYTINFTTAMPDANYSAVLAPSVTVGSYTGLGLPAQPFVFSTGSTRFNTASTDCAAVSVAIFR
jgi:hypothetical protein